MDDVLFVCTGNICRSPLAEALLAARLAEAGVPARVHSAGLMHTGSPAHADGVVVAGRRGVDLGAHRSRRLDHRHLDAADLVVGMAREHVREAVVLVPEVWPRAFTLKELVRRGDERGGRSADEPIVDWLARLHQGRSRPDLLLRSAEDDVADPIGRPASAYERMYDEIDSLVRRLVELAWPPGARAPSAATHGDVPHGEGQAGGRPR